jgi:predicted nucleic acid-binding protein
VADGPAQRIAPGRPAVAEPQRLPAHLHPPPRFPAPTAAGRRLGADRRLAGRARGVDPDAGIGPCPTVRELVTRYEVRGNFVPDAQLAALALEHGLAVCSTDTDFARFPEIRWQNPLA